MADDHLNVGRLQEGLDELGKADAAMNVCVAEFDQSSRPCFSEAARLRPAGNPKSTGIPPMVMVRPDRCVNMPKGSVSGKAPASLRRDWPPLFGREQHPSVCLDGVA